MVEDTKHVISELKRLLGLEELELFLSLMRDYFFRLGSSNQLRGFHMQSSLFDELCQQAGKISLFRLLHKKTIDRSENHNVILVSELSCLGGHLEIVRDIVRTSSLPVVILVTNINNKNNPVMETILDEHVCEVVIADGKRFLEKLRDIQKMLSNEHIDTVHVLVHGYDSVAIAAIGADWNKKVFFYHHCDHYPALGCHLKGTTHIDLHNVGFWRCRNEYNVKNNRYLPTTSTHLIKQGSEKVFRDPCFKTASCGGYHKINIDGYYVGYQDLVCHILERQGGIHYHIGILPDDYVLLLKNTLVRLGLSENQFVCIGEAVNLPETLLQLEVDFYFPTLPLAGGKAFVDAMSVGIPIIAHCNARDRLLSGIDLIYPSALTWATLDQLDDILDSIDESFWREQSLSSQSYFDRYHSIEVFSKLLLDGGATFDSELIPELNLYEPDIAFNIEYSKNN